MTDTLMRGAHSPETRQGILNPHTNGELKWTSDEVDAPALGDEEQEVVNQRMLAVDKLFREQGRAKYKIELLFGASRATSRHQPIPGLLQYFESGGKTHSGGDVKLYACPAKTFKERGTNPTTADHTQYKVPAPRVSDCEAPLTTSRNGFGFLYCQACEQLWTAEQVVGEFLYRLPMQKWAEVVYKHFRRLDMNADVVVKFAYGDLRAAALMEQARQRKGDLLAPVRAKRPAGIYELSRILKDVNAGADLMKRFYAFLTV